MIFKSEWTNSKYKFNLVRCFPLHSTKFQYFFYGCKSQLSNSYDNWYVQKYLKGIFHAGMLLIKEYFTRASLLFSSYRCAIIPRLNVIYTKFTRAMIAHLNKIWRMCACDSTTLTAKPHTCKSHGNVSMQISWKCIHAHLMEMHTCISQGNVYMPMSCKCIHANLMEICTCKSHRNVYMQTSWKCIHANAICIYANLMKMDNMQISWICIY